MSSLDKEPHHPAPFKTERQLWRTLDANANTEMTENGLPAYTSWSPWGGNIDRRQFLRLVEAALAAAGLSSCTLQPPEKALPYVVSPEEIVPGKPLYYATSMPFCGYGLGVIGTCHMGRPIKTDGNPLHAATLGKSNLFMQASVLSLYDPDRSRTIVYKGATRSWADFTAAIKSQLNHETASLGGGIRILTETVTSPSLTAEIQAFLTRFPKAQWICHDPSQSSAAFDGTKAAFGQALEPVYDLKKAARILTIGSDLLFELPGSVRYAYDFSRGRDLTSPSNSMNRLYTIEASPTITGASADHRLAAAPSRILALTQALTHLIAGKSSRPSLSKEESQWIEAVAKDLLAHKDASLVVAGRDAPTSVHTLTCLINEALGATGRTVKYVEPIAASTLNASKDLGTLVQDLTFGLVSLLIILDANPVYHATGDMPLRQALQQAKTSVHVGSYYDETASQCQWHIPASHYLESWGDLKAYDGSVSLQQPLIRPLFHTRTPLEIMASLRGAAAVDGYGILRNFWQRQRGREPFETFWQRAIYEGVIRDSAPSAVKVSPRLSADIQTASDQAKPLEVVFRPDPTIWDGRYVNNAWLQETPKPFLTLTWSNAILIGPKTAAQLSLVTNEIVKLKYGDQTLEAPVLVMPGQAEGTLTLTLGYGRERCFSIGKGCGYNPAPLRRSQSPWVSYGVEIAKTGRFEKLALTQTHHQMAGRDPIQIFALSTYQTDPEKIRRLANHGAPAKDQTFFPRPLQGEYQWGMTIDLNQCIGCNACIVACQSENNVPVVGKDQVLKGREMHWIRVDRYFEGEPSAPLVRHQPVPCMQCEQAPCEVVCPVGATLHDEEGLNEMIYNRCVGTRYCSNNCPYKVRRFNFLTYSLPRQDPRSFAKNPDVSVRERGVMEKCTYCIQRINAARITAEKEGRKILDGEIVPACAAACPTETITFGNIADPKARVSIFKKNARNYDLLAELNTRPRTSYLAKLDNHNPDLKGGA